MATRPKAAKVSNVTTRSNTRTTNFLTTPDPLGFYLENADKRKMRPLSQDFNRAFFDNLKCADAQELQSELRDMRKEPEPCKNTAKVIYNSEKGMQRAIMCAIMSVKQDLRVYVQTGDLEPFLASESVKCFDKNYKLELTLLYPKAQQNPPSKPETLYCHGGFSALALTCVDTKELEEMRQSTSLECKNFSRMWYNPEENMEHVIMCAIISMDQTLHLYVNQEHLPQFLSSESVHCFDRNYTLRLTLLRDGDPQGVLQPEELHCHGGFRALKGALASDGRLQDQEGVQVVRFTENTHVAESAFNMNKSLMELLDVNKINEIHDNAFNACNALQELGDMQNLKKIGKKAFFCCIGLGGIGDMPALQIIQQKAFEDCYLLKELGNMQNLKIIGKKAFSKCWELRTLPKSLPALKTIREKAFQFCLELETLGDMRSLKTIGEAAFEGNAKLQTLGDMRSLKTIGEAAFQGNEKLQTVCLPKSLDTVEEKAFEGCPLEKLSVEPGAEFDCYCENLASKLRLLKGVNVAGKKTPYRVWT